jgi:hypothetical protein
MEPGTLHIDLKGMMIRSVHGYHYAMFAVDEFSRYIFVEFLKTKEKRDLGLRSVRPRVFLRPLVTRNYLLLMPKKESRKAWGGES